VQLSISGENTSTNQKQFHVFKSDPNLLFIIARVSTIRYFFFIVSINLKIESFVSIQAHKFHKSFTRLLVACKLNFCKEQRVQGTEKKRRE